MASYATTFNNLQYEYTYGIHLLDDLHNILPEVMYDTSMFQTSPLVRLLHARMEQLFPQDYVRNRTHYRLFQQERRHHQMSGALGHPIAPASQIRMNPTTTTTFRFGGTGGGGVVGSVQPTHNSQFPYTSNITIPITTAYTHEDLTSYLLLALARDATPVPVTPSQEILEANTILTSTDLDPDLECTICQSHEPPSANSQQWRILRACRHAFHQTCIDRWFSQNVHCPVCRHDIRENASDTETDTTSDASETGA